MEYHIPVYLGFKARHPGQGTIRSKAKNISRLAQASVHKLGMDPLDAKDMVVASDNYEVVVITPALIRNAIDCSVLSRIMFWDALVVSAAESAACGCLVTEGIMDKCSWACGSPTRSKIR